RLDRALASNSFINRFSPVEVSHLSKCRSDHAVIRIVLEADSGNSSRRKEHIFSNFSGNKRAAMKELDDLFKEYRIGPATKK
ncbi:hypothetical protein A2U01_0059958, partial [Trifolium medium]|nr:hypothetical protein [Trifolium medium]